MNRKTCENSIFSEISSLTAKTISLQNSLGGGGGGGAGPFLARSL